MDIKQINEELEKFLETSDRKANAVEKKRIDSIKDIENKIENGEELTDEEQKTFDKYLKNNEMMTRRRVRKGEESPNGFSVKQAFKGREEELEQIKKEG